MIYGYVRVSTADQNIDRQMVEMYKQGLTDKQIYIDKQSGKNFDREAYKKVITKLKANDVLVIKSIDRLGRNYDMIIEEWAKITKTINADIVVIDMPILDTRQREDNLVGKFIADIVLQILSFVSQNEREITKQRQAEGIAIAKAKGIHLGRPTKPIPINFEKQVKKLLNNEITATECIESLGMTRGTFYRNFNEYKKNFT